jgi:hypothetical protein
MKLIQAFLFGIVVAVTIDAIMAWFMTTNPQPELLWVILSDALPILGGGFTVIGFMAGTKQ